MKQIKGIKPYRKIAIGYAIIALLTGCIVCVYLNGWQKMEMLKVDSERLHLLRREIHDAYVRMTELSLLGETVMDWSQTDPITYRSQRMGLDSILRKFKTIYPSQRIDSVRRLLANKEKQLYHIHEILEKQEATYEQIALQVPIITKKAYRNHPRKKTAVSSDFSRRKRPK